MKIVNIITLILSLISATLVNAETVSYSNVSGNGLTCTARLHDPDSGAIRNKPIIFIQMGSGPTTSPIHALTNDAYYLYIDKPGLTPNPDDPNNPTINKELYLKHTTNTLVDCADKALLWADKITGQSNKIIFYGHSEGAMVVTRLLEKELEHWQPFSKRITSLLVSGIPMDSIKDIYDYQMPPDLKKKFWDAYNRKDSEALFELDGEGYNWYAEAFYTPPLSMVFDQLATLQPMKNITVEFFQAINDEAVPAKSVMNYELNNEKTHALHLSSRYYNSGHMLNDSAHQDIIDKIETLIKKQNF